MTVTEVLNKVVTDLIKARDLVASYDTLSDENILRLTVNGGNFDVKRDQQIISLMMSFMHTEVSNELSCNISASKSL